jgi:hypothetical protein
MNSFLIAILGAWAGVSSAEKVELTTAYPSPSGVYTQIVTTGGGGRNTLLCRDSGNVGIGVLNPSKKLDVKGSGGFTDEVSAGSVEAQGTHQDRPRLLRRDRLHGASPELRANNQGAKQLRPRMRQSRPNLSLQVPGSPPLLLQRKSVQGTDQHVANMQDGHNRGMPRLGLLRSLWGRGRWDQGLY